MQQHEGAARCPSHKHVPDKQASCFHCLRAGTHFVHQDVAAMSVGSLVQKCSWLAAVSVHDLQSVSTAAKVNLHANEVAHVVNGLTGALVGGLKAFCQPI